MKKLTPIKLLLDAIMIILLVLMYNAKVISLTFHEVGGLILLGIFIIHICLNYKWVIGISKRILKKGLPMKTRFSYLLSILLIISFLLVGISGIFISKVVFGNLSLNIGLNWKSIHYASAAWALIFTGIHIGLHFTYLKAILAKHIHLPKLVARALGIIVISVSIVYGSYSIYSHQCYNWIAMPFTSSQNERSGSPGDFAKKSTPPTKTTDSTNKMPPTKGENGSKSNVLLTILDFLSITMLFASITAVIPTLLRKKRALIHMVIIVNLVDFW